jgi:DNA (cytosine-5)-methyltransferase 1
MPRAKTSRQRRAVRLKAVGNEDKPKKTLDRPVAIDLFAGAGGLALGFEQAGFDISAAVEFDPIHAATHELNFPEAAVICGDVRSVSAEQIRKAAGLGDRTIDAVIGGPPCQGFSLIGHRVLDDPRNSLVFHFFRLVVELKPRVFMMENVPGMATGPHTELLNELIQRFSGAGYQVRVPHRLLNAADYGVPQDRRRLFLLGARSGERLPEYPEATASWSGRNGRSKAESALPTLKLPLCPTVDDAIGDLPEIEDYRDLFGSDELVCRLSGGSRYARILRGSLSDPRDFSYQRLRKAKTLTGCRRARHTPLSIRRFAATNPGETEPVSRFYRLPADGVCNTLRAGTASDRGAFSAPRPIHPSSPRCISVREAARLHSFPDWFQFHATIWHGFRQIGNSVPPSLGRAVGAALMKALGRKPVRPDVTLNLGPERLVSMDMREAAAHFKVSHLVIAPRLRPTRPDAASVAQG